MIKVTSDADRVLVAKLQEAGQDHLFASWDDLSAEEQKSLLADLRCLDLAQLTARIESCRKQIKGRPQRVYEPPQPQPQPRPAPGTPAWKEAREAGIQALRAGQVAAVMSAGAASGPEEDALPKGCVAVGPVSGKSLYRLQAEKVLALGRKYRSSLPFLVITSDDTDAATRAHFEENDNFGLSRQDLKILRQPSLPVVSRRGQVLRSGPGRLARAWLGHGAALTQVLQEETLKHLESRGIQHVFIFQVENPLVDIADPVFVGQHVLGDCDISSKAIRRRDPDEQVGVFCRCNGSPTVVEFGMLGESDQERRDDRGELAFGSANAGIQIVSTSFLRRLHDAGFEMPHRFVERTTAHIDRRGRHVQPKKPNSYVFRTYVADVLPEAKRSLIVATEREREFSPISDANDPAGSDPSTASDRARVDLARLYARWLRAAGADLSESARRWAESTNGASNGAVRVEISPLYALDVEDLERKVELPLEVTSGLYLE